MAHHGGPVVGATSTSTLDGVMLAYERRGAGETLVLLHGLGSHRGVWSPIIDAVAAERDVVLVDLPGFGESPLWTVGDGSVPSLADRVAEFLDELGIREPHVAGSSMGGGISLELGRRGLARTVTAFAPAGFWDEAGVRRARSVVGGARALGKALGPVTPSLMRTKAGRAAMCGIFYAHPTVVPAPEAIAAAEAFRRAPGFDAASKAFRDWRFDPADLGRLPELPVTVVWGTRDVVLPYRKQAGRAREILPNARHLTLHGCGHLPFADDPKTAIELLTG
jgi:pimeloyl-ACP methyl ester carboxylesterase